MRQQFRGRGGQSFRRGGQRGGFQQRNARPNNNQQPFKRGRGRGQGRGGRKQQGNQRPQNQQRRPQPKQRQGQQQDNVRRRGGFKNLRQTGRKGRIAGIDRETLEVAKQITQQKRLEAGLDKYWKKAEEKTQ
ncbi:hypothetical protein pb186bvf_019520 [Paramecium bursaria]